MNIEEVKQLNISNKSGSYQFFDDSGEIIYVGKAVNLRSRVLSYWGKGSRHSSAKQAMVKRIKKVEWIETDTEIEALLLEANLIKKYHPSYNVLMRDDKRYSYLRVSVEDEIPTVSIVRKIGKTGKYFGPFISGTAVKETLKVIRKIWPYCTQKKKGKKPCFYYEINRCMGVCGGVVDKKEYVKKVIRPIIMFLEGKKQRIVKEIKKEEEKLSKDGRIEEALKLKMSIKHMNFVLDHAKIIGVGEKYAADVVELAKVLGLEKVPNRIEGYDTSNIFGKNAVGSMVVFVDGEAEKSEYKKFKINLDEDTYGDVQMMQNVFERRFNRYIKSPDEWSLPDLIIVDGAKAQLNVALRVMKKFDLNIPVIAISKGEGLRSSVAPDKIFFPGEKEALQLPLASPALHVVKRVRDEAHRFAISFHRQLRSKNGFR